jgi:hypothetical protein
MLPVLLRSQAAVRRECSLSEEAVPPEEVAEIFGCIDADGSGAIDAAELGEFLKEDLQPATMTFDAFFRSMFELASVWVDDDEDDDGDDAESGAAEQKYVTFLRSTFDGVSMPVRGHQRGEPGGLGRVPVYEVAGATGEEFVFALIMDNGACVEPPPQQPVPSAQQPNCLTEVSQ